MDSGPFLVRPTRSEHSRKLVIFSICANSNTPIPVLSERKLPENPASINWEGTGMHILHYTNGSIITKFRSTSGTYFNNLIHGLCQVCCVWERICSGMVISINDDGTQIAVMNAETTL